MKNRFLITLLLVIVSTSLYARPIFHGHFWVPPIFIGISDSDSDDGNDNSQSSASEESKEEREPISNDFKLRSTYMLPVDGSDMNPYLTLGFGAEFWSIFELIGNTYFEVDTDEDDFFDMFQSPEVLSVGVGVSIPVGSFYIKGDYQRIIDIADESSSELTISDFSDSVSCGIGVDLTTGVDLDFYYKTFFNQADNSDDSSSESLIGVGLSFTL